jgi:hypothetical protein
MPELDHLDWERIDLVRSRGSAGRPTEHDSV